MTNSQGFWSYVHADDEAEGGRISRLAVDVKNQYQMLTGETISLFLDKVAIVWGEDWRDKVDANLESVAFFIPVLTPRYFMSPECRREMQVFAQRATRLGIKELILSLYYVDVPAIENKTIGDNLIELVCTFQREDWRDLRFMDVTSEGYRRGVERLARRLVDANRRAEKPTPAIVQPVDEIFQANIYGLPVQEVVEVAQRNIDELPVQQVDEVTQGDIDELPVNQVDEITQGNIDEPPGTIDILANAEKTLLMLPNTLKEITKNIVQIGSIMKESTEGIKRSDSQGKGFAGRLLIARRSAAQMGEPTNNIGLLSNKFVSQIISVDEGFRIIIERAPAEINDNPDAKTNFCDFFGQIRVLNAASHQALDSTQTLIDACEPLERMSRDLRPVLRLLRQGLMILFEAGNIMDEWIHLIESSSVICEGSDSQTTKPVP